MKGSKWQEQERPEYSGSVTTTITAESICRKVNYDCNNTIYAMSNTCTCISSLSMLFLQESVVHQ